MDAISNSPMNDAFYVLLSQWTGKKNNFGYEKMTDKTVFDLKLIEK